MRAEAAFNAWLRRLINGAAELRAFEAGQIDAVMDPMTGTAILLPEARAALQAGFDAVLAVLPPEDADPQGVARRQAAMSRFIQERQAREKAS